MDGGGSVTQKAAIRIVNTDCVYNKTHLFYKKLSCLS